MGEEIRNIGAKQTRISGEYEILTRKKLQNIGPQGKTYVDIDGDKKYSEGLTEKTDKKTDIYKEPIIFEEIGTLREKAGNKKFLTDEKLEELKVKIKMFFHGFGYVGPDDEKIWGHEWGKLKMHYNDKMVLDMLKKQDPKLEQYSPSQIKYGIDFDTQDGIPEFVVYKNKE